MIVSAFPATGKSYIFRNKESFPSLKGLEIADSDSSAFSKLDFPKNYLDFIEERLQTFDLQLVSTHASVRQGLLERGLPFVLVMPHHSLKDEYLQRCYDRNNSQSMIDFLDTNWDSFFDYHNLPIKVITLSSGQYLSDVLEKIYFPYSNIQ